MTNKIQYIVVATLIDDKSNVQKQMFLSPPSLHLLRVESLDDKDL